MRKIADKFFRDNMQQSILNQVRKAHPNFEFEHRFMRLPVYSKIILYSNVQSVDSFASQ